MGRFEGETGGVEEFMRSLDRVGYDMMDLGPVGGNRRT